MVCKQRKITLLCKIFFKDRLEKGIWFLKRGRCRNLMIKIDLFCQWLKWFEASLFSIVTFFIYHNWQYFFNYQVAGFELRRLDKQSPDEPLHLLRPCHQPKKLSSLMTSEMENRTGAVKKSQTNVEKQYDGSHWVAKMTRPGPGVHLINTHSSVFMA